MVFEFKSEVQFKSLTKVRDFVLFLQSYIAWEKDGLQENVYTSPVSFPLCLEMTQNR